MAGDGSSMARLVSRSRRLASTQDRKSLLTEAFGSEVAEAFDQNLDEYQKLHFEAYKVKVASQRTNFLERSRIAAKVPSFWARSLQNCRQVAELIDAIDEDVFNHLSDVWIQHDDKDPRNWEITLTFDAKNPFFSNKTLTKKFSIEHPSSTTPAKPYDLEAPLYLLAPSKEDVIKWTSDEHNLVKKAPRPNLEDLEEFDEFDGAGSFFNLFGEDGEDKMGVGEALLEWFAHATEYAAGLSFLLENNDDDSELDEFDQGDLDDEDEDDEDDPEDLNAEIDLEQEEEDKSRPKKRSKKN
ncbi:BZ3500_MvSof-1268-A1-R1_Chr2-2g04747 [Microbotryum saponariae]|uniref:BZ3500_MvSof-1268-A1-R1_Chr2-2g04747 protein n=1 Tax=Microbotryum saponariae TaxID=289078 RepID=A0A2X0KMK3_9BASI|nr:BZ3500_MvSof-1268-A1-R1_Chr2-2g04747 [Microbotryum saponariae]SDA00063.1 BZ3501_MvSof-1269-A2-R1_Chr2-2g04421 [Microbotryum saponariae]